MSKVYFFGFFCDPDQIKERDPLLSPATTAKMQYIADSLAGFIETVVVSPGFAKNKGFFQKKTFSGHNFKIIYLETKGDGKKYLSISKVLFAKNQLKIFFRTVITKKDIVIIYSQPWCSNLLIKESRKKNIKPILEIEELHSFNQHSSFFKNFFYYFIESKSIKSIEKTIVVNNIIKNKINKNSLVCYGMYLTPAIKKQQLKRVKKHILYSGAIDKERGIFLFLESLEQMPSYLYDVLVISITGYFHGENALSFEGMLQQKIQELLAKGIKISFLGLLPENKFEELLLNVDICVSPQLIANTFSSYSFPSKILKYLSYGRLVVSSALPSIIESPFKDFIVTYNRDDPIALKQVLLKAIAMNNSFYRKKQTKQLSMIKEQSDFFQVSLKAMILEELKEKNNENK